jgi:hypothetical protein
MAVLGKPISLPEYTWSSAPGESEHEKAYRELQRVSYEASERGEIVGRIIRFPVADGHATYQIAKVKPLTLRHVDYIDGYSISAAEIRGLRIGDVEQMLDYERRLFAIFGKKV